jgi:hypothetical protein
VLTEVSLASLDSRAHQRGHRDALISTHGSGNCSGFHRNDRLLANDEEPPVGAHFVTPFRGFAHHDALVHYLNREPVQEVSHAHFTQGHSACIGSGEHRSHQVEERLARPRRVIHAADVLVQWCSALYQSASLDMTGMRSHSFSSRVAHPTPERQHARSAGNSRCRPFLHGAVNGESRCNACGARPPTRKHRPYQRIRQRYR